MALPVDKLGTTTAPQTDTIDPDRTRAYAAATNDDNPAFRYADASGDRMPIHLDESVAKSVGLPGIIIHGLCTMALCSQAVIKTVADGDPARLRRLAVRFAKNVLPGSDVTVTIYD